MQGISLPVFFMTFLFFVFSGPALAITQSADLTEPSPANGDRFGFSIDVNGENIIVGAPNRVFNGHTQAGAAFIFDKDLNSIELVNPVANDFNQFGYSVAIDKDTAIVGAIHGDYYDLVDIPLLDIHGNQVKDDFGEPMIEQVTKVITPDVGVVWIYRYNGSFWYAEIGILNKGAATGDWLGYSVDTENNHIVAGSPLSDIDETKQDAGAVYVFTRYTNDWKDDTVTSSDKIDEAVVTYKLQPADLKAGDWFGSSVAISNNTIVVGADGSDLDGVSSGAAYVFTRNEDGTWQQQARLRPSDAGKAQFFGRDVAIDGNTLVVGAYQANAQKGAAYVFKRSADGVWNEAAILTDSSSLIDDHFGSSVAVSGSKVYVSAYRQDSRKGVIYLFEEDINNDWTLASKQVIGATSYEDFSYSIAAAGDKMVVGIPEFNNLSSSGKIRIVSGVDTEINTDLDSMDNSVDTDDDNDGIPDVNDLFPTDATEYSDIDQDGFGDNQDAFAYNATESFDTDGDGMGNNMDLDDDNDGILDVDEVTYGTNPLVANPNDAQTVADAIANDTTTTPTTTSSGSGGGGVFDSTFLFILLSMFACRRFLVRAKRYSA